MHSSLPVSPLYGCFQCICADSNWLSVCVQTARTVALFAVICGVLWYHCALKNQFRVESLESRDDCSASALARETVHIYIGTRARTVWMHVKKPWLRVGFLYPINTNRRPAFHRDLSAISLRPLHTHNEIIKFILTQLRVARMGEERKVYKVLVGQSEGERTLRRPRRRWEDGIRMDRRETGWGSVGWWAFVDTVMNLRVMTPRS
jgi:hypothetical protein